MNITRKENWYRTIIHATLMIVITAIAYFLFHETIPFWGYFVLYASLRNIYCHD